jgi:hypothetical protein
MAGGDAGVEQTIRAMRGLIDEGKKDPCIHELGAGILRAAAVPAFDWAGEVRSIGEWVHRNVRFTRDVYGKETLHSAREIVRLGIGDCDDFVILICSLLGTIGVKTRIVTISSPRLDPSQFTHVFPEAEVEDEWIPVDYARRSPEFGVGPDNFCRRRIWSTSSDQYTDIQGLQGLGAPAIAPPAVRSPNARLLSRGLPGPAGFAPNALPGAYQMNIADPRFRRLRAIPVLGTGHYGMGMVRRSMRGMGQPDDSFNFATLPADIAAAGTTAANIISAERAAPTNLFPTTGPVAPAVSLASISPTTLLLFGVIGLGVFLVANRGGAKQ